VILFDNAGISSTSGEVPASVEEMAVNAAAFIRALGLARVDVLGFSLGGLVAQALTLAKPGLVRRLVLVGTGPRGGEGMASLTPEAQAVFGSTYANPDDMWLGVFFTPTEKSQAAGRAFLKRFRLRQEGRDPEVSEKVGPAQITAIGKWGAPRAGAFDYLREITHPTLVINGSNDVIIYTVNSFILQQNLPNAQLILYPDSNHGSQYQYPALFVADTLEKPGSEGNQLEVPPSNDPVEQPANENPATRYMATRMPMKVCFWSANCIGVYCSLANHCPI